jgi:uncharacterized protein YodC (DUF2158 family)
LSPKRLGEHTMDFQKGDVVRLKSGGPKMTVSDIKKEDSEDTSPCLELECVYYDASAKKYQELSFEAHLLKKSDHNRH